MKKAFTLLLTLFVLTSQAQHQETRALQKFHGIAVSNGIDAKFTKSSNNTATIRVSRANIAEKLQTEVKDGILYVRVKKNSQINNAGKLSVDIHGDLDLDKIQISSAGVLEITNTQQVENLHIKVSSAGQLITQRFQAEKAEIAINSAGQVVSELMSNELNAKLGSSATLTLSGTVNQVKLEAASAAKAKLRQLEARNAVLETKSGASVEIQVTSNLDAKASSGGSIRYSGSPSTPNIRKSSGGRVTKI